MRTGMSAAIGIGLALALVAGPSAMAKRVKQRPAPAPPPAGYALSGPRMIQVAPGRWSSSWDCVSDEGQGRRMPCSTADLP